jgi:hypothetical protein
MHQERFAFIDERTIEERFQAFHGSHPEVLSELEKLIRQLRARGHKRYSIKGLVEVLRFHHAVDGRPDEPWKLNNVYTSRYARMLVESDPSLATFFETRQLKSE